MKGFVQQLLSLIEGSMQEDTISIESDLRL